MGFLRETMELHQQLLFGFRICGVLVDALDRTDHHALRLIKMTYAFGTPLRMNDVDVLTLRNCLVWTCRFTDITVDAKRIDDQCHGFKPKRPGRSGPLSWLVRWLFDFFKQESAAGGFHHRLDPFGVFRFTDEQYMRTLDGGRLRAGEGFDDEIGHAFAVR